VEADLDTAAGAPNTDSFLAPELPEKLNAEAGPGSVADFPKAKRLAGFSVVWPPAVVLLALKEKAAPVPELVVAVEPPPPKLNVGAGALKEAALVI